MTIRTFISASVEVTEEFAEFQKALKGSGARLRMTNENSLHLTLKFLGDIDEDIIPKIERAMVRSVSGMQPITATLQGTGVFPNEQKIRVIWVGLEGGESLLDVQDSLEDELEEYGFQRDDRTYIPHLTVARTKFDRRQGPDKNISNVMPIVKTYSDRVFGSMRVDKITLMKSEMTQNGPVYSVVREVPFF